MVAVTLRQCINQQAATCGNDYATPHLGVMLQDVSAALAAACPGGIDVVYEGVGGALRAAIWPHIKPGGKLLQVGRMKG
jgi:NADPH-dependent curcumin reductase CurA